jgi:hypothetical protein
MGEQLMQCTKCHKEAEKLTAAGICFDCEFERQTAEVERERKTITVDQLFAAIENASGPDEIGTAFGQCEPPTDAMEQEVLRERLVRALAGKVKRPGAFVDGSRRTRRCSCGSRSRTRSCSTTGARSRTR